MKIKKYAAIDIGSNAIRMLVSNVIKHNKEEIILKILQNKHKLKIHIKLS